MNIFKYSSSVFKVVIMMLAITSCKVTVESLKPEAAVPTTYGLHNDTANMAFKPWQIFYTDTTLTKLLGDALERSLEMKITTEEVNFYAAQFQQAGRILYPVASVGATSRVDRYGEYTMNGVGNDDTNRSESLPRDQLLPDPYPELFVGVCFLGSKSMEKAEQQTQSCAIKIYGFCRNETRPHYHADR
ncbi:MAG: hypothetical protein ABIS36_09615 [Chryseolinea sp.]